ncbi:MAG: hypothetical protein UV19_C0024G0003 [Parcubacteria group bacterium GW2011_GWA2_42_28]|nr:MAG: hypothetical protein UV19_C0024G0003 [Parcubacteria group bacterium GW2011_GWA2_42_28]
MNISIREISQSEYQSLTTNWEKKLPLWLSPKLITCYQDKKCLVAYRGNYPVGVWVVPMERKIARRRFRHFPYASPFLLEQDNLKRREVVYGLLKHLIENCAEINLPFDPDFTDLAPVQGLGAFVEWRHTHLLKNPLEYQKMPSRLRNHIKNAQKLVRIVSGFDQDQFNFEAAIKGVEEERQARKENAVNLLNNHQAIIFSALKNKNLCGGIFISFDSDNAYLMHSWQTKSTPRGTMSALIYEGVNWILTEKLLRQFDFEGSLFQQIDYYYSGFNAEIRPYGHVFWNKEKDRLFAMVEKSINIPGRLF